MRMRRGVSWRKFRVVRSSGEVDECVDEPVAQIEGDEESWKNVARDAIHVARPLLAVEAGRDGAGRHLQLLVLKTIGQSVTNMHFASSQLKFVLGHS